MLRLELNYETITRTTATMTTIIWWVPQYSPGHAYGLNARIGIAACYAIFDPANVPWSISGSCRSSSIPRLIDECTLWTNSGVAHNTTSFDLCCFFFFFFFFGVAPLWDLCHVNDASLTNAKHNSFHSEGHYISSMQAFAADLFQTKMPFNDFNEFEK